MAKRFFLILCLIGLANFAWAQDEDSEEGRSEDLPFRERLYYSGGFDLQLGNITVIGIYPTVGYKITTNFSAGLGISYQYTYVRSGSYIIGGIPRTVGTTGGQHVYGGKVFTRYKLPASLFLHAEYETLSIKLPYFGYGREWYGNMLAGAGYSAKIGEKSSMNLMVLYNLNRSSENALYRSEFVPRVEFAYNF